MGRALLLSQIFLLATSSPPANFLQRFWPLPCTFSLTSKFISFPMPVPTELHNLVERFTRNHDRLREHSYKEAQLRVDFLNPLFDLLGWDLTNKQGLSEQKREVITEDRLLIDGRSKAPDYSFGLGGERKFFVEAKKPSVDIAGNWEPAYQLRTYAWTAALPVSLLTDFEEIAIYDCRIEPKKLDKPTVARIDYFRFDELIERWDWFNSLFHRDAVAAGSLEEYAKELPKKRGVQSFDAAFLKELEEWRELLAVDIARRNHELDAATLTDAVQRMIDRILFLRFAEDRGIEQYGALKTLHKEKSIYGKLFDIFQTADRRYNSGLFHFRKERGRGGDIDTVAGELQVGDEPLKHILSRLYYPDSPYAFSVIPADILGQVYEQFLGKVITLGARHKATVEEKPEVRKAGGVFYTPTWVVREIVQRTIGRAFEGKTAGEMEEFRALDPACGSGSFLLGAFDQLLAWHRDYYVSNQPKKWENAGRIVKIGGNYRLTLTEKKRVLRMLYGVDIDRQAVEVTKLSLLLKLLEEENGETLQGFGVMDRILPDLDDRIVCGNSLIGYDVIDDDYLALPSEDQQRINPFDWEGTFPFMKNGGFDCVIGNPPYLRIQGLKEWAPFEVEWYKQNLRSAAKGNYDLYVLFVERGLQLLNSTGKLGFILPHKFFNAQFGEPLRQIITKGKHLHEVVHFGAEQVFAAATTYTCLLLLGKKRNLKFHFTKVSSFSDLSNLVYALRSGKSHPDIRSRELTHIEEGEPWEFSADGSDLVLSALRRQSHTLADITRKIFVGLQTSADAIYAMKVSEWETQYVECWSKSLNRVIRIERGLVRPFLFGRDVHRYEPAVAEHCVIFPYDIINGKAVLIAPQEMKKRFPLGWKYLVENQDFLAGREKGKMEGDRFYAYIYPKNLTEFDNTKIISPEIAKRPQMTFDKSGNLYHTTTIYSYVFMTSDNPLYYLGIINSEVFWFFLSSTGHILRGGYFRFKTEYLKPFPIPCSISNNPPTKQQHDQMVALVERMLALHKKQSEAKTAHEKTNIVRQIEATDQQIDKLVYELYELTDEEIAVVEEAK